MIRIVPVFFDRRHICAGHDEDQVAFEYARDFSDIAKASWTYQAVKIEELESIIKGLKEEL